MWLHETETVADDAGDLPVGQEASCYETLDRPLPCHTICSLLLAYRVYYSGGNIE